MSEVVRLEDIHKEYVTRADRVYVLRGMNLSVEEGEFLVIVGASGAGKSTLLHIMGLLDRPTRGTVFVRGDDASRLNGRAIDNLRNRTFGFVFQFYHLLPEFDALENTLMPQMIRWGPARWLLERRRARKNCKRLLEIFGLSGRMSHRPSELSGGEQQRVAIARALAGEPQVLLADEPTGNLDEKTGAEIMEILLRLNKETGQTLVMVTHERELALRADRILHLKEGKLFRE